MDPAMGKSTSALGAAQTGLSSPRGLPRGPEPTQSYVPFLCLVVASVDSEPGSRIAFESITELDMGHLRDSKRPCKPGAHGHKSGGQITLCAFNSGTWRRGRDSNPRYRF